MLSSACVRGTVLLLSHPLAWAVAIAPVLLLHPCFHLGFRVAVLLLVCLLLALRHQEIYSERLQLFLGR
eukprot:3681968-Rhodomonas_salina.6